MKRSTTLGLVAAIGWVAPAAAQWTVTSLHPAGATSSSAAAICAGREGGSAVYDGPWHAILWNGDGDSWVDLHPAGAWTSWIQGMSADQQVGTTWINGKYRAILWSGTAASWVDLNPVGMVESMATAVDSGQQVGQAYVGSEYHASLWGGTAESWVDLNPAGASSSRAFGVRGGQQVGSAAFGAELHAGFWRGTAASWVDLHGPVGGGGYSEAFGVYDGQQVGYYLNIACLWNGTAESRVNLTAESIQSRALAVFAGHQAGYAYIGGVNHASVWSGTAASREDLSLVLVGSWGESRATGIWTDGVTLFVTGYGHNNAAARDEALLWTRPLGCGVTCDYNDDGGGDNSDIIDLADAIASDTDPYPNHCKDFNQDGGADNADVIDLADAVAGGGCP